MTYSEEEKYWIAAACTGEVTPKLFYYIMQQYGCAAAFFDAVRCGSDTLEHLPKKAVDAARAACSDAYVAETVSGLVRHGIRAVTRLSDEYPPMLAAIDYPPPVLFVKGSLAELGEGISIVGTRRSSVRGFQTARNIAKGISAHMTVVSGMALGIDTAAHKGAMDAGAPTVAVLGCGVDVIYPPENAYIYDYAAGCGAVVSELPPGTDPARQNFPARNRIVTGLSRAILVVESEMQGGTAISAVTAIGQGRDVFAVPGMPRFAMSALSNTLIKQGAVPVTEASDILRFYGFIDRIFTKSDTSDTKNGHLQLDFLQKQIYNLLQQADLGIDEIARRIDEPQSEINAALTMMELFGIISRLPGSKYGLKN